MNTIYFQQNKKQVVKVNDKYAARYKYWWQTSWTYIGINSTWSKRHLRNDYILEDSKEAACKKLKRWFPKVVVLNDCQQEYEPHEIV